MTLRNTQEHWVDQILSKFAQEISEGTFDVEPAPEESNEGQVELDALQATVKTLEEKASQLEAQSASMGATIADLNTRLGTMSKSLKKPRKKKNDPDSAGAVMMFPGFSRGLDTDPDLEKLYQDNGGGESPTGGLTEGPPTLESLQQDLQYVNSRLGYFDKQFNIRSKEIEVLQSQVVEAETFLGIGDTKAPSENPEVSPETAPWISGEAPDTSADVMQQFENDQLKEEFDQWYGEMQAPPTPAEPSEPKQPRTPKPLVSPQEQKEWDEFLKSLEPAKPEPKPAPAPVKEAPAPVTPSKSPPKASPPKESPKYNPIYDEGTSAPLTPPKPDIKPPKAPNAPLPPAARPKEPEPKPKAKDSPKKTPTTQGPAWGEEKEEDWTPKEWPPKKTDDWDEEYAPEVTSPSKGKPRKNPRPKEKVQDPHFYNDNPSIEEINNVLQQTDQRSKSKR